MSNRTVAGADHVAALDGLRGVAAFAVMLTHFCVSLGLSGAPKAYLAVDFFFVLSGYVLAHAYEDRLRRPGFLLPFLRLRLIRLYPLIPLGMLFGFLAFFGRNLVARDKGVDLPVLLAVLCAGLLLLPFGRLPNANENHDFPFNPPIWSLMFEMIANLAYAAVARWLSNRLLLILVVLSGLGLALICQQRGGLDVGEEKGFFAFGLLRVAFSFAAGVGLFRAAAWKSRVPSISFWLLAPLLFLTFQFPQTLLPRLYDAGCILVLYPLAVSLGLRAGLQERGRRWALLFGRLSYPLYVTHFPFMFVSTFLYNRFPMAEPVRWGVLGVECAAAIGFAWLALRWYDEPVRAALRRPRA